MMVYEIKNNFCQTLLSKLRDKNTCVEEFRKASFKLSQILISEALSLIPYEKKKIDTPVENKVEGLTINREIVFLPILRAGLSMLSAAIDLYEKGRIGFIGIKRNEETLKPELYYFKIPVVKDGFYIILDPMLATGGTAALTVKKLIDTDIKPENIIFVSLISAPEGIEKLSPFKKIKIVTASIDRELNNKGYILPGLGDAGDRFCFTEGVEVIESYGD